jgi:hypothetical protein
VDSIQNHVHDLASIMNENIEAVAKNEESLKYAERLNAQSITTLENAIEFTGLTEVAMFWHPSSFQDSPGQQSTVQDSPGQSRTGEPSHRCN